MALYPSLEDMKVGQMMQVRTNQTLSSVPSEDTRKLSSVPSEDKRELSLFCPRTQESCHLLCPRTEVWLSTGTRDGLRSLLTLFLTPVFFLFPFSSSSLVTGSVGTLPRIPDSIHGSHSHSHSTGTRTRIGSFSVGSFSFSFSVGFSDRFSLPSTV